MRYESDISNLFHSNELAHFGIKGQRWGFRRFQNEDGTLTPAGRSRYDVGEAEQQTKKDHPEEYKKGARQRYAEDVQKNRFMAAKRIENERKEFEKAEFDKMAAKDRKFKNAKDKRDLIKDFDPNDVDRDSDDFEAQLKRHEIQSKFDKVRDDYKTQKTRLSDKAKKRSEDMIKRKYGKQALSDIDYYNKKSSTQKTVAFLGGLAALGTAFIIGAHNSAKKVNNHASSAYAQRVSVPRVSVPRVSVPRVRVPNVGF